MTTYFRALTEDGSIKRWRRKAYTSFHHSVPATWSKTYSNSHSENADRYPLCIDGFVYTAEARESFLHYVRTYASDAIWKHEHREKASELAGICAYRIPSAALQYASRTPFWKLGADLYVEIEGAYVCELPEPNGVVVSVERQSGEVLDRAAFKSRHNI